MRIIQKDNNETPWVWFFFNKKPYMIEITKQMINSYFYHEYNNPRLGIFSDAIDFVSKEQIHDNLPNIIIENMDCWEAPNEEEVNEVFTIKK